MEKEKKKQKVLWIDFVTEQISAFLFLFQIWLATRPRLGILLFGPDAKLSLKTFQVFIIDRAFWHLEEELKKQQLWFQSYHL